MNYKQIYEQRNLQALPREGKYFHVFEIIQWKNAFHIDLYWPKIIINNQFSFNIDFWIHLVFFIYFLSPVNL